MENNQLNLIRFLKNMPCDKKKYHFVSKKTFSVSLLGKEIKRQKKYTKQLIITT